MLHLQKVAEGEGVDVNTERAYELSTETSSLNLRTALSQLTQGFIDFFRGKQEGYISAKWKFEISRGLRNEVPLIDLTALNDLGTGLALFHLGNYDEALKKLRNFAQLPGGNSDDSTCDWSNSIGSKEICGCSNCT
jgi:hypothetical protein